MTAPMGRLVFQPLPEGDPLVTSADYNPGGLSLWYRLAAGVVDAARPGGLPYGESYKLHHYGTAACLMT